MRWLSTIISIEAKRKNAITVLHHVTSNRKGYWKKRIGAKVIKKYDEAKSPYNRLRESKELSAVEKYELRLRKNKLDLQQLLEKKAVLCFYRRICADVLSFYIFILLLFLPCLLRGQRCWVTCWQKQRL